jgi:uncharacterized membrane protein
MARVTAIFDDRSQAERAITDLRQYGITDAKLSVVSRRPDDMEVTRGDLGERDTRDTGERVGKGALAGAGVGALFGLAALAIPGVGPFVTAGVLSSALGATAGTVAAGAAVGATSGALAGALAKAGYNKEEAEFFGPAVERGSILLAVDADGGTEDRVRSILTRHGGRTYGAGTTAREARREERSGF